MGFNIVSDIHIDFAVDEGYTYESFVKGMIEHSFRKEDNLIIAGDISNSYEPTMQFLEGASKHWKHIYIVCGNHDFYSKEHKKKTLYQAVQDGVAKSHLKDVVTFFDCKLIEIDGMLIVGLPLMYNLDNTDTRVMFNHKMNDSRYIPAETIEQMYSDGKKAYEEYGNEADIIVSHVPFTSKAHQKENCYKLGLLPKPNKIYFCGHTHEYGEHEPTNGSRFYLVAIGYPAYIEPRHSVRLVSEGTPITTTVYKENGKIEVRQ